MKKSVFIVIPAYKEEANIAKVVAAIPKEFKVAHKTFSTKVVVIDDGSSDATYEEAKKTRAIVLRHVANSGAGAATRTGLRYAEQHSDEVAYVITIDGDGQHNASDIKKLLNHAVVHHSPMIVGNRLHSGNKTSIPAHRKFGNWGLNVISRVLFGIKVKDSQSGLRLFSADILPAISYYTLDRYGFCTETLWQAKQHHIRVDEVPIEVKYSEETMANGQNPWGGVELVRDLFWIRIAG